MTDASNLADILHTEIGKVLVGENEIVQQLLISLLTGGHVILEGVPGVAKTTLANLFAHATGLTYNRIQMTPDILPADITGTHIYREQPGEFELQKGPIFSNILLADEINRATPKTQSALLEAMQEQQVTIEGETLELPIPFMVIATQNPIEYQGTYELPVAQRDRFQLKLEMDYPEYEEERAILHRFHNNPTLNPQSIQQVISKNELENVQSEVQETYVDEKVMAYILNIIKETRSNSKLRYGASPRTSLAFLHASKARAALNGRTYVIPDDIKALARPILIHRILLTTDAELNEIGQEDIISEILASVNPPGSESIRDEIATTRKGDVDDSS